MQSEMCMVQCAYCNAVKVETLLLENVTWQMSAALVMNLEDEL